MCMQDADPSGIVYCQVYFALRDTLRSLVRPVCFLSYIIASLTGYLDYVGCRMMQDIYILFAWSLVKHFTWSIKEVTCLLSACEL
jgi:hypothetical protein